MKYRSYIKLTSLIILFAVSFITLYANFFYKEEIPTNPKILYEEYDTTLTSINTIAKFDSLVEQNFKANNNITKTIIFIDEFLKKRFYHGYSQLSLKKNWFATICSKLIWNEFIYPVSPNDILSYPMAACSQQGILFQDQLHKLNIPYETIAFRSTKNDIVQGHYAVSAFYDNRWHYYDTNQEPIIVDSTMPSIDAIIDNKLYEKMYINESNIGLQDFFKNKNFTKTNKNLYSAKRMYNFQAITSLISKWLWLLLLVLTCFLFIKK